MQMLIEDKQNPREPRIKQQNIQGMMREGSTEKAHELTIKWWISSEVGRAYRMIQN